MSSDELNAIREQLVHAMRGDQSHLDFNAAVDDFPFELSGLRPKDFPHTAWQLLEHMRIAQHDILEFSRNAKHKSPKWPEGYWPESDAATDKQHWEATIDTFRKDAEAMEGFISDPAQDLFKPIEGGTGQTLLREALVLAAHNSYHLGQLVFLKKTLLKQS